MVLRRNDGLANNPAEPLYEWVDISKDFFTAIKDLELGEIMRLNNFRLFEAMSAIEMMDPKMDAGMNCNKTKAPPLTFETAVSEGHLKLADLTHAERIGIMDSLLACLVSWLEGQSLAQTVYTCLYMHKIDAIEDKPLQAFCYGLNNLMDLIKEFIHAGAVFEEEDFQPMSFPYPLKGIDNNSVITWLKQAEDDLLKEAKKNSDKSEDAMAVFNRLKFLRFFLDKLLVFDKPKHEVDNKIIKQLSILMDLLNCVKTTIHRGTQPLSNSDAPNPMGFSPLVNQRMLPPNVLGCIKIKSRADSLIFLEELMQRLKLIYKVTACSNYHAALNFFMNFSRKAGSCILSRSVLQKFYLMASPTMAQFTDFLKESARQFIAPPVLTPGHPLHQNEAARRCVDAFFDLELNVHTMYSLLKTSGYNRARQRNKLVPLLHDFVLLQEDAERVDVYMHSFAVEANPSTKLPPEYLACFGTWVLYNSLRAMCSFLLSGFELELYSVHEYLYIYWYLYEFLFGWIVSALTRADSFLSQEQYINESSTKGGGKKGDKREHKKKNKKAHEEPYATEILLNQALQNMCGGYYKGLAGFWRDNRIPQPLPMFDNEVIRYNYRFAPFANFKTPPAVSYCEFRDQRANLLKVPSSDLYAAAAQHFQQARLLLEKIPNPEADVNDTLRVAKVNCIVMNLLAKGHKRESKLPPQFDFSTHPYFPTIKQQ